MSVSVGRRNDGLGMDCKLPCRDERIESIAFFLKKLGGAFCSLAHCLFVEIFQVPYDHMT